MAIEIPDSSGYFTDELEMLARLDPALRPVIAAAGPLPARTGTPGFEGLARSVVAQLVSRQSADAIWKRLSGTMDLMTPEACLAVVSGSGPRHGLSTSKADTLVRIAEAMVSGALDLDVVAGLPAEDAIARLIAIKGIGRWTAEVHLLFNAGHADIFPAGDLALRVAVGAGLDLGNRPDAGLVRSVALRWAPHRSTAARLFWAYYARLEKGRLPNPV